jgi:hypothetical protein
VIYCCGDKNYPCLVGIGLKSRTLAKKLNYLMEATDSSSKIGHDFRK